MTKAKKIELKWQQLQLQREAEAMITDEVARLQKFLKEELLQYIRH